MSAEVEQSKTTGDTHMEKSENTAAIVAADAAPAESTSKANETAAEAQAAPSTELNGEKAATEEAPKTADTTTADPSGETVVAPDIATASDKKSKENKKRRLSAGVPEHKNKKATPKKKGPELQLDAEAGDMFLATMKGYPKWPAIICDDEMLPETLLGNRPVTARRPDGTYREDFLEGGKNARDRTYPVMYLGTYEFSWMVNTALSPLTAEQAQNTKTEKMTKSLELAFSEAKEGHDLDHYKQRLIDYQRQAEEAATAAAAKKAKTPKKSKKKSSDVADDEDEDMPDADAEAPKSTKSSTKKRKAEADGDEEGGKKKMKLNLKKEAKTPTTESASKAKASKAKTPKSEKKAAKEKEPQLSEKEKHDRTKQNTLYCRHRLQKAFLTSDTPPKDDDMPTMAKYFEQLEKADGIDAQILRDTKIHKVMKGIVKLASIPKDDEFHFKERSQTLLDGWNKLLGESTEKARPSTANGEKKEDAADEVATKIEEKKEDGDKKETEDTKEDAIKPVEPASPVNDAQDATMPDADAVEHKDNKPTDTEAETSKKAESKEPAAPAEAAA